MVMQQLPYEWVERFFGTYIADNFNTINLVLAAIGLVIAILLGRRISFRLRNNQSSTYRIEFPDEYEESADQDEDDEEPSIYQAKHGAWSPTGWVYDRDTMKWDPPEYLEKESREKWRWDDEKRIWIDKDKEFRKERYHQWRKEQGKGPTFEEWKAQRERENNPR